MNLHNLLGKSFDCKCGRRHELPIRKLIYRDSAINMLPRFISGCGEHSPKRMVIVAAPRPAQRAAGRS